MGGKGNIVAARVSRLTIGHASLENGSPFLLLTGSSLLRNNSGALCIISASCICRLGKRFLLLRGRLPPFF